MDRSGSGDTTTHLSRGSLGVIHAGFILTGVVTTLLGPLLPVLSARWSLLDKQAGYFFMAQFVGSMGGVLVSGLRPQRQGYRTALISGYGLMAAGTSVLGLGGWRLALGAVFCYGLGLGLTIPTTNLLVAEANPDRRGAALNLLNLCWGIGAIGYPPMVALSQAATQVSAVLHILAATLALTSLLLLRMCQVPTSNRAVSPDQLPSDIWTQKWVWALGAMFFLYVGSETVLGGWVATYAHRVEDPSNLWILAPSFFWGALLAGRALAPVILRHVTDSQLLFASLLLATLGATALLAANTAAGIAASAFLAGLGLAAVFPAAVALLSERFGMLAPRVGSLMFLLGGLGGAVLPWSVGFLATYFSSLKIALVVPLLGCVAMTVLYSGALRPRLGRIHIIRPPKPDRGFE
ncbi:MAG: MFS transporter [Acidobacteria bacterium]|nr:MFS transporter [Acidobacteriota bacterium]